MRYKSVFLITLIIFLATCIFIYGDETSTKEDVKTLVSEFLSNYRDETIDRTDIIFYDDIEDSDGNPIWVYSYKGESHYDYTYTFYNPKSKLITGCTNKGTNLEAFNIPIDTMKTMLQDFAFYNYKIIIDLEHIRLSNNYPINKSKDLYWELEGMDSSSNILSIYIDCYNGDLAGFKLNNNEELWFDNTFGHAQNYVKDTLLYDYRENTLSWDRNFPILKDDSFYYKFKRILDDKAYYIYIGSFNNLTTYIESVVDNTIYTLDDTPIVHKNMIFGKKVAKEVAIEYAQSVLNLDTTIYKVNLNSEEYVLPWFTDLVDYDDICWKYTASDSKASYEIYVSAYTGEVCEVNGPYPFVDNKDNYIDKSTAKSIADNYLKNTSPQKYKNSIFVGYSSIYANGWTSFQYARFEDGVIYTNDVMVVYLNPDGSLNSFYQTSNTIESTLPIK